jgi:hypothetical protein
MTGARVARDPGESTRPPETPTPSGLTAERRPV